MHEITYRRLSDSTNFDGDEPFWDPTIDNLRWIWSDEIFRSSFVEACKDWLTTNDPGEIFVIVRDLGVHGTRNIGVTGWRPVSNGKAFLRWHGIDERERGRGLSKQILDWLCQRLVTHYGITYLYELAETEKARDYFLRNGFTLVKEPLLISELRELAGDFNYTLVRKLEKR